MYEGNIIPITIPCSCEEGLARVYEIKIQKNYKSFLSIFIERGRLTRAKTKALTSHGKNAQGFMLEKSNVQSYTMVMNGGVMVDGKSTLSSSLKKDSYVEVVARKPWKGFKIAGKITKPKRATVEEKRMKGKQLLLAYE